jgi:ParB family chromosome partitioning protein
VVRVPLSAITASPMQPRKHFREEQLTELMESIREHGIIQPLTVRRVNGTWELIAGERRWRASKRAGLQRIPALVRVTDDGAALEQALAVCRAEKFWQQEWLVDTEVKNKRKLLALMVKQ